jgi:hypothetical protein
LEKHLHIVYPESPWPANHGLSIELLHKLRSLHREGLHIHLHIHRSTRGEQRLTDPSCATIDHYASDDPEGRAHPGLPRAVAQRSSAALTHRLKQDDHPILFAGLETTLPLASDDWSGRKICIRLFDHEHAHAEDVISHTRSWFKKFSLSGESRKWLDWEKKIVPRFMVTVLHAGQARYCRERLGAKQVMELPAFIGWDLPLCLEGVGHFCLYHGNLAEPENAQAATWLLEKVFQPMEVPFVIAGKSPSAKLVDLAHKWPHTCIVADPSEAEMQDLIKKAQVQVLPSMTHTGLRFKILNGVFCGRHIVTNQAMVKHTKLESACHMTEEAMGFQSVIMQLYRKPFTEEEVELRSGLMHHYYNNAEHARQLISWLC